MNEKNENEFDPGPVPANPGPVPADAKPAASERSDSIYFVDRDQASSSQRARLIPPDRSRTRWWVRYRRQLHFIEWLATLTFILLALYFLWLLLFTSPERISALPDQSPPTREDFQANLRSLAAIGPRPAWKVAARPDRWRGIVVHHTGTDGGSVASIDKYHRESKKYENGFAYHFLIGNGRGMGDGEVAVGPRWEKQDSMNGAHVVMTDEAKKTLFGMPAQAEGNSFSIGIALVGNFEEYLPTPKQLSALRGLLDFLRGEYKISLRAIVGHGQVKNTLCPGRHFYMDEVVLALANP